MSFKKSDPNIARELKKHPTRNVAVVGLFDKEGRILLVRTKRFPDHWQPIGGGMKNTDSTPIETLKRELREETNLDLAPEEFEFQLITDYDFGEGKVYFYTALLPSVTYLNFDSSELIEWKWFTWDSIKSLQMFPATRKFISHINREKITQ
jgi:8-oxo-dGTP pyrophosphatase MutT (NUDIX family)